MQCLACQSALPAGARFCPNCAVPAPAESPSDGVHSAPPVSSADPLRQSLERALGERYEVVRLLGRGGMGAVYLARENALDRLVAIKVLPPEAAGGASSESRERFRREARTVAKLAHPNIVPLHAFSEADGLLYFVMGYVRGESLADRLRHEGKLPADDVRRTLAEIADALDYAHRSGIVHRDVKPDNIMLEDESGRPMLTDFGVARVSVPGSTLTQTGAVVGTAHYMSPEQAAGDSELDGRSDLYSLGVVGYAMLAGRPPFEGKGFWEIVSQHAAAEPPSLRAARPDVPEDLANAVMSCLAKDPAKRSPDGKTLKDTLGVTLWEDDDALSGELREVAGAVFWSIGASWLLTAAVCLVLREFGRSGWYLAAPWTLLFVPAMYLLTAAVHRRKGVTWQDMARVAKWPPKWWPLWWPRGWRRPGDVWYRLPPAVLRLRRYYGLVAGATFIGVPGIVYARAHAAVLSGFLFGLLMLVAVGMIVTAWWAHRIGFPNNADLRSLFLGSTVDRRFWKKPPVARLLLTAAPPGPGALARPEPTTPYELLRALIDLASRATGLAREPGSEAVSAARQAVAAATALDEEIAALAGDTDPTEVKRLEGKLASLHGERPTESEEQRTMRRLVGEQLALVRRLEFRVGEARRQRQRVIELLRNLWLQLADPRAGDSADTQQASEVSARVRAVCVDIERCAAAVGDPAPAGQADALLGQPVDQVR